MCTFQSLKDEDHSKRRLWASKISKNYIFKNNFLSLGVLLNLLIIFVLLILIHPSQINASVTNLLVENTPLQISPSKLFIKTQSSPPVSFLSDFENLNNLKILENKLENKNIKEKYVWVTAYSSSPDETDDTPHITASGTITRDGIVATNILPFKTKIKIPEIFGDKIFVVEDRMHQRKTNFVDIWMPSKEKAIEFGIYYTKILILEENTSDLAQK